MDRATCLNAPYGARCFLAGDWWMVARVFALVLMHLMALGAFWPFSSDVCGRHSSCVLMHLMALGAF